MLFRTFRRVLHRRKCPWQRFSGVHSLMGSEFLKNSAWLQISEKQIIVEADRTTLRQAIINLLDNATKYTPLDGHISVVLQSQTVGTVSIEINDSGPGIPNQIEKNSSNASAVLIQDDPARQAVQVWVYRLHNGRWKPTGADSNSNRMKAPGAHFEFRCRHPKRRPSKCESHLQFETPIICGLRKSAVSSTARRLIGTSKQR